MGGCAGKFKSSESDDAKPEPLPSEAPISRDLAETETIAQENKEGGDEKTTETEAPLVDVCEPKQEGENTSSSEPKSAVTEAEAEAEAEDKHETSTATLSEEKAEAPAVVATKEAKEEAKPSDAAPTPTKVEDNKAPLVTV